MASSDDDDSFIDVLCDVIKNDGTFGKTPFDKLKDYCSAIQKKANSLASRSEFSESNNYFQCALKLAESIELETKDGKFMSQLFYETANVLVKLEIYLEAWKYCQQAINLSPDNKNFSILKQTIMNRVNNRSDKPVEKCFDCKEDKENTSNNFESNNSEDSEINFKNSNANNNNLRNEQCKENNLVLKKNEYENSVKVEKNVIQNKDIADTKQNFKFKLSPKIKQKSGVSLFEAVGKFANRHFLTANLEKNFVDILEIDPNFKNIKVCCSKCLVKSEYIHKCPYNTLFVQNKKLSWSLIRERTAHKIFNGSYTTCSYYPNCYYKYCTFAHNDEEMKIWNAEKNKRISIRDIIKQNRPADAPPLVTLEIIFENYPGKFQYVCATCFTEHQQLVTKEAHTGACPNDSYHDLDTQMVVYSNEENKSIIPIFLEKCYDSVDFSICSNRKYCEDIINCQHPHSVLEKEIWLLLMETDLEIEDFIKKTCVQRNVPPYFVEQICGPCWKSHDVISRKGSTDSCEKNESHSWSSTSIYILQPCCIQVKSLPVRLPRYEFRMCGHMMLCNWGKNCQFAHSEEEIELWSWMINHKIKTMDELIKLCKEKRAPQYFCFCCEITFEDEEQLRNHNNTLEHKMSIEDDSDQQWNFRHPPINHQMLLCLKHEENKCPYSNVPNECNYCLMAHSQNELDEWKERFRWKEKKMIIFKNKQAKNLVDMLKTRLECQNNKSTVAKFREGIEIKPKKCFLKTSEKACLKFYNFEISSKTKMLKSVCLPKFCYQFSLHKDQDDKEAYQIIEFDNADNILKWNVTLKFECGTYGSYSQSVIFDFGDDPVMVREVRVDVGSEESLRELSNLIEKVKPDSFRWTKHTKKVKELPRSHFETMLYNKYSGMLTENIKMLDVSDKLTVQNYRSRMHSLLKLEQMEQMKEVSRLNVKQFIDLNNTKSAPKKLKIEVSATFPEGSLASNSIKTAWIAPICNASSSVYEVLVIDKGVDFVEIEFDSQMYDELLKIYKGKTEFEIQFQLNQTSFYTMHYAIDQLKHWHFLFPIMGSNENIIDEDVDKILKETLLNQNQQKIFKYAYQNMNKPKPPMVVYGPFGTGKSKTISIICEKLTLQKFNEYRILICCKTNSTADQYVLNASHPMEQFVFRLNSTNRTRHMDMIHEKVKRCSYTSEHSGKKLFSIPHLYILKQYKVIITTLESCLKLEKYNLHFTHIFIDEAAQDLECRMIMPLCLADENTSVIIVGDHQQMMEKVFSQDAQKNKLNVSLLERLVHYYLDLQILYPNIPLVFLNENYRNHNEILAFLSTMFYSGSKTLNSNYSSNDNDSKIPMEFVPVNGEEQRSSCSNSYYNKKEALELVKQMKILLSKWKLDQNDKILITTPYQEQVNVIRERLKHSFMYSNKLDLFIEVMRVQNLPGLEYKVVFISTVRIKPNLELNEEDNFYNDPKLLNTAFSRAKSKIVVVGDPSTLLMEGKCSHIWYEYLKRCNFKTESISSLNSLKQQTIGLVDEKSKKTDRIINHFRKVISSEVVHPEYSNSFTQLTGPQFELNQIRNFSERFIRGKIHIETRSELFVTPINSCCYKKIFLKSWSHCGRAFNLDEVLIELSENDMEKNTNEFGYGKVIEILRPRMNAVGKNFVCRKDDNKSSIFIPLNPGVPYIAGSKKDFELFSTTNASEKNSSVFYVLLMHKWVTGKPLPLGIVINKFCLTDDLSSLLQLSKIENNVPVDQMTNPGFNIIKDFDQKRGIVTAHVYSIKCENTGCIENAFSIDQISGTGFIVGIHTVDVSSYIPLESSLDEDCRLRAMLFESACAKPIYLLPEVISKQECSLKKNQVTNGISIFITINYDGSLTEISHEIKLTCLNIADELTFENVEKTLEKNNVRDQTDLTIKNMYKFVMAWAHKRIGADNKMNNYNYYSPKHLRARFMLREIKIIANRFIGKQICQTFRNKIPMYIQHPPTSLLYNEWFAKHQYLYNFQIGLTIHFESRPTIDLDNNEEADCVEVASANYEKLNDFLRTNNRKSTSDILFDVNTYAQTAVAINDLIKISNSSEYIVPDGYNPPEQKHHGLNEINQTPFSSPLTHYIDIVVQRLLHSSLTNRSSQYTTNVLQTLCSEATDAMDRCYNHKRDTCVAYLCEYLKYNSIIVYAYITQVDETKITLFIPFTNYFLKPTFTIETKNLNLSQQPWQNENNDFGLILDWSQRIYHLNKPPVELQRKNEKEFKNGYCSTALTKEFITDIMDTCLQQVYNLSSMMDNYEDDEDDIDENFLLTSELSLIKEDHFCTLSTNLKKADIINVQLSSKMFNGVLSPYIQLLFLSRSNSICIEHLCDPVDTFCFETTLHRASKFTYNDCMDYCKSWRSALSLESAYNAVFNEVSAIINDVQIEWSWKIFNGKSFIIGEFCLNEDFCNERGIHCKLTSDFVMDELSLLKALEVPVGYVCVKYNNSHPVNTPSNINVENNYNLYETYCLVLHCNVVKVLNDYKTTSIYKISIVANLSYNTASNVLHLNTCDKLCSVEWMEKPLTIERMTNAMGKFKQCYDATQEFILHREIRVIGQQRNLRFHIKDKECNNIQNESIYLSLHNKITLIQGPPGTGKTFVALNLVKVFAAINSDSDNQVLCAGPSNKSVDVIAVLLKEKIPELKLLRVYSEKREDEDIGIPSDSTFYKKKNRLRNRIVDKKLEDISLHHIIRRSREAYAEQIKEVERQIKELDMVKSQNLLIDKLKVKSLHRKRRGLIDSAQEIVLKRVSVILVTCVASGAKRIGVCKVKQLIIDECSMSMEPESLIPIAEHNPEKIVLIGDHKQLRPIVMNRQAADLGLSTSLFHRFDNEAFMLTIQYRMHKSIAEFPSKQFYANKLVIGNQSQAEPSSLNIWPGGRNSTIAFIDCIGLEEVSNANTEKGGLLSKRNCEQADIVVEIAKRLVNNHNVSPSDIGILSYYRLQCSKIVENLPSQLMNIDVQTVVASQGSEWKYIILSTVRSVDSEAIPDQPGKFWLQEHLGSVADPHQTNVAITRAKLGLFIIGNKDLLQCNSMWRKLIDAYVERGACVSFNDLNL